MALGSMGYNKASVDVGPEILYNHDFIGKAVTLDTTAFTDGVCKAGTPIADSGVKYTDATGTALLGILLHDVAASRPQGTAVYAGTIRESVQREHSGVTITDAMKEALPRVTWFDTPTE